MDKFRGLFSMRFLFIIPALCLFSIFVYYPFLGGVFYSFTQWDGVNTPVFIGMKNYMDILQDSQIRQATLNTLYIVFVGIGVSTPLSLLLALGLNRPLKSKHILRTVYYLPSVISLIVVSLVWGNILQYDGILNALLTQAGLGVFVKDWLGTVDTALLSMVSIMVFQSVGYGAVIYLAGLQSIPQDLKEAARMDGASGWYEFWHITLPLLMPSITISTFMSLVGGLKMFDLPFVLTNGGPGYSTTTLALTLYKFLSNLTYGYAAAGGVLFMIMIVIITLLQLNFTRKREVEY
ncbi:carbohydrate ABC transporter permease [Paenibacillus roseipurpureus]|uniref:Sugar ABC transporter permease n=1 Tax=Paenibacillus roseopurpureus TaxID=2918901 RepID=A0AA96RK14_9BACL|nr:sugar ABC transporter permease [Paenibacillus sp. MBLB1832]WNR45963.1 sugar ABC transporter permease [Paenibacillus sp. MBLB1832]